MQTRTHVTNRVYTLLEDTNSTWARVVSDVCGKRARRMLEAFMGGERDPQTLSVLARGSFRRKSPQLDVALAGQCTEHHVRRIAGAVELVDVLGRQSADMDQQLQAFRAPRAPQLAQLVRMPGVRAITARDSLAEMGLDMARCDAASRLSAWAGLSPGNDERAGTRRQGRTRQGNRSLRRVLVPCAWATRKTSTFLGRTLRRLEGRLGSKKAAMAVAHKILVIIYHLLLQGTLYAEERSDRLGPQQEERDRKRAIKALECLGDAVTLDAVTSPASLYRAVWIRGAL